MRENSVPAALGFRGDGAGGCGGKGIVKSD